MQNWIHKARLEPQKLQNNWNCFLTYIYICAHAKKKYIYICTCIYIYIFVYIYMPCRPLSALSALLQPYRPYRPLSAPRGRGGDRSICIHKLYRFHWIHGIHGCHRHCGVNKTPKNNVLVHLGTGGGSYHYAMGASTCIVRPWMRPWMQKTWV